MKKIFYTAIVAMVAIVTLTACSDDPEFPDPGLDMTRAAVDTVRRDTIDIYTIEMNVAAPNGVEAIQVLNGRNYKLLDEITDRYKGQSDFILKYDVDLTSIERDTTMQFIVKIIDSKMRSYNKGFTLVVKAFSSPVIKVSGGADVLGLVSPVFNLKAQFETGLNRITSYRVLFGQEVKDEGEFNDTIVHTFIYNKMMALNMQKGNDYKLNIELNDDKGNRAVKELTLKLVDMKRPVRITVTNYNGMFRDMELYYDKTHDRLDSIVQTNYTYPLGSDGYKYELKTYFKYTFDYGDNGMVSKWSRSNVETGETSPVQLYTYKEGTKCLLSMDQEDPVPSTAIDVTEWYDDGKVATYYYGTNSKAVKDVYYVDDIDGKGKVFAEYWSTNKPTDNTRQHGEGMTAILIPTYFPELPNVIQTLDAVWRDLFFYKYVFEKSIYTIKAGNAVSSTQSATTDNSGRIVTLRRTVSSTSFYNYVFTYEE
ncbi:MAG: hypothetical protein ACI4B3_04695 [Prevotella sp.]